MKTKRILSALMSVVMVFIMFSVLTVLTVTEAPLKTEAATSTEKAIFIGSTTKSIACTFIPLNISVASTTWYKLSFKCLMLKNGRSTAQAGKPSIGILGQASSTYSTNYAIGTCPSWAGAYASDSNDTDDYNNNANLTSGVYSMYFKLDSGTWNASADKHDQGDRTFYLTIGNAAYRNFGSHVAFDNMGCSFIFSNVSLYQAASNGGATSGSNLLSESQINDTNVDFNGTYYYTSDAGASSTVVDSPLGASAGKWHKMNFPDYVKYITVPSDYNTSGNYASGKFTKTAATDYTREYYTNSSYSDLKFAKLANSNDAGFEVIPADINKKMVVIEANHEGEDDNRTAGSYKPARNKPANIFIPLSLAQYNLTKYGATASTDYIVKVSFTAKRLEGSGSPVLGRIYTLDSTHSQAYGKSVKNVNLSGYYAAASHEIGNACSYNASTGAFVGWVYMTANANNRKSKYGISEILTIGNAEHVWEEGTFDTTEFNTSFAISNIKVDVYSNAGSYTAGSVVAEDIAPALYADTLDDTTNWAYQCGSSKAYSEHSRDVARAKDTIWQTDGCTGMVHAVNLTNCMKNSGHTITAHAATSSTCEYYSCSSCGKNYAEPYCATELSSTSASKQMIVLNSAGSNTEAAFMTARLGGFTGNQWFKFTCKVKRIAGSGDPVVGILYGTYDGNYKAAYTSTSQNDGDYAIAETSYDASSMTLTAYFKPWNATNYNKGDRYPYRRYNATSGANIAITVGNAGYVRSDGNELHGAATVASAAQYTSFAIAEPALYKINYTGGYSAANLTTAKSSSVDTSTNYATPITSKTTDVTYPGASSWNTANESTNNPLTAPKGKWYVMNSRTTNANSIYVSSVDIPTNYFTAGYSPSKKMLKLAGAQSSMQTNGQYIPFAAVGHLESSTTYQLDYDYREFGGTTHRLEMRVNGSAVTRTTDVANGYHRTVTFTTPAGLPLTSSDNFRIEIGPQYEIKYEYSLYLSDIKLRKTSDLNGSNYIVNGDFAFGSVGVVNWSNYSSQLAGYANNWLAQYNPGARLLSIPSGFFSGTAMAGDTTIALKATGSTDNNGLYFRTHLASSAYYRLSFKYQFYDTGTNNANARTVPTVDIKCRNSSGTDVAPAASSVTKNSGGNYSYTVNFTTPSSMQNNNSVFQANTGLYINFGSSASNKTIYVTDVEMYKLQSSGGSVVSNTTGCANLLGNVNEVFDSSLYSGLSSVGNSASVTLGSDNNAGVTSYNMVNGWYKQAGVGSTYLVKVPSNFFSYKTGAQRVATIRHLILADGEATSDGINPIYNPNGDATWGDVKDLVHTKQAAITNGWS